MNLFETFDPYSLIEKIFRMGIDLKEALVNDRTPIYMLVAHEWRSSSYRTEPEEQESAKIMDFFSVESMGALDKDENSVVHTDAKKNILKCLMG